MPRHEDRRWSRMHTLRRHGPRRRRYRSNGAFTEFKKTNDANLQKQSAALDEKLDKINKVFDKYEPMTQQLVMFEKQNKAMQDQLDAIEKIANRAALGGQADPQAKAAQEYMDAFNRCMRRQAATQLVDELPAAVGAIITDYRSAIVEGRLGN